MKKLLIMVLTIMMFSCLCGCKSNRPELELETTTQSAIDIAKQEVIDKFKNEAGAFDTSKFIEDKYKLYPDDATISNIYFYCVSKEEYDYYIKLSDTKYLDAAIDYALKIDPNYNGEFADEMHSFAEQIIPNDTAEEAFNDAANKENTYTNLTNSKKKEICQYIQSRYDYYDELNGGYSGDKYSDIIMQEAADKYGLTTNQIDIIWMNYYSY